jgi:hypothetical protein
LAEWYYQGRDEVDCGNYVDEGVRHPPDNHASADQSTPQNSNQFFLALEGQAPGGPSHTSEQNTQSQHAGTGSDQKTGPDAQQKPQQSEAPKPPPSWDPSQPLPDDPTKLGPDWRRDPEHKAPNDERWVNDKTGDKLDWHNGKPGEKGWKGKDHWHWNEHDWHFEPGDTVKRVTTVITVGVVIYWIVSETSRIWFPPRNLAPVP